MICSAIYLRALLGHTNGPLQWSQCRKMMFSESIFPILPFVIKFLKQECVLGPVFSQGIQKRHWLLLSTWDLIRWDNSFHHNTSEKSPGWYLFGGLLLDLNRRFSLEFWLFVIPGWPGAGFFIRTLLDRHTCFQRSFSIISVTPIALVFLSLCLTTFPLPQRCIHLL